MSKILEFNLGTAEHERLRLRVSGRERPDFTDDDRNWLQAFVEVRSGRFAGSTRCSLRTEDVSDFRGGLALMTDDRAAVASFKTMEDHLTILVERVPTDRLKVTGHVREGVDRNSLAFAFSVGATDIPTMLRDLDEILDEYPIE